MRTLLIALLLVPCLARAGELNLQLDQPEPAAFVPQGHPRAVLALAVGGYLGMTVGSAGLFYSALYGANEVGRDLGCAFSLAKTCPASSFPFSPSRGFVIGSAAALGAGVLSGVAAVILAKN